MSNLKANCPSCAAAIEFKSGSTIVKICSHCRSAVARTDRSLDDLGKVAEIAQSDSPLKLGLNGKFDGKRFELTGRAQIKHEQGGVWDEWYASFSNGWLGWLAEAQGKFYLTFFRPIPEGTKIPKYADLKPGQRLQGLTVEDLLVNEKGIAEYAAADGEIPYKLLPGEKIQYVDLVGKGGVFATINYDQEPPYLFYGSEVTLGDLGLAEKLPAERQARKVGSAAIGCPNCGGSLELKAPDKTERVTCPFCSSLLDANHGELKYLHALEPQPESQKFVLEIGKKCVFGEFADGAELEIIGAMIRSVAIDGVKYFWHEYLLYNPNSGFKWLVHSDNHWNFVESVNVAELDELNSAGSHPQIRYGDSSYKIFQDAPARVEYVKGEFYWRVEVGDEVRAADFIAPPFMLSRELTATEVNWSIGTYLPIKNVQKATGVTGLPKPWSVAPNQPYDGGGLIKYGFALLGLLFVIGFLSFVFRGFSSTPLPEQEILLQPLAKSGVSTIVESQEFDLVESRNIRIEAAAPVSNSWAELNIDLINATNNNIEAVQIPIEYYFGTTGGENWSEGGKSGSATISAVPSGKYKLRIESSWQDWAKPMPIRVKVEQNVTRGVNFLLAFILVAIGPILGVIKRVMFESSRWSESMFGNN